MYFGFSSETGILHGKGRVIRKVEDYRYSLVNRFGL